MKKFFVTEDAAVQGLTPKPSWTDGLILRDAQGKEWKRFRRLRAKEVPKYLRRQATRVGMVREWGVENGVRWIEQEQRLPLWTQEVSEWYRDTPDRDLAPPGLEDGNKVVYSATLWRHSENTLLLFEWYC